MKINLLIFLVVFLIFDSHCNLGVDVSQLYSTSVYDCLKKNNFHFAIIRGYCSYGGLDHNINQGLTNAKNAGL